MRGHEVEYAGPVCGDPFGCLLNFIDAFQVKKAEGKFMEEAMACGPSPCHAWQWSSRYARIVAAVLIEVFSASFS